MRIVLVGFGTVGRSLAKIFLSRKDELFKLYGFRPRVVAIADSAGVAINPKGLDLEKMLMLKAKKGTVAADPAYGHLEMLALDAIESVEAEAVVEVSPTNIQDGEPAMSHIKKAFKAGKHVVTANKGPLAIALPALTELAEHNKVHFRFSASVGASTPFLEFAKRCLFGDRILSIRGILNGTTNYILTEMSEKRMPFEAALQKAKELGYAEADPFMDIEGVDTACKIVILANWVMNRKVTLKDVSIKGIKNVDLEDIEKASQENCAIKLLGSVNGGLKVKPEKLPRDSPLAVSGTLNAVTFTLEFAGEQTVIGHGAGGVETASALLRDLLDIKQKLSAKIWLET
ncbi:MAG: homoserine dehydrogenase [Candidatus Bathyarchaeia archaeon]